MQPFQLSKFEPQHHWWRALVFRCMFRCDNELRYRMKIDWTMLGCYALSGRTGSIISLSQGGAALCPGLWFLGLSGQKMRKARLP